MSDQPERPVLTIVKGGKDANTGQGKHLGETPPEHIPAKAARAPKTRRYLKSPSAANLRNVMAKKCPGLVNELARVCAMQDLDDALIEDQVNHVLFDAYRVACETTIEEGRARLCAHISRIRASLAAQTPGPFSTTVAGEHGYWGA